MRKKVIVNCHHLIVSILLSLSTYILNSIVSPLSIYSIECVSVCVYVCVRMCVPM